MLLFAVVRFESDRQQIVGSVVGIVGDAIVGGFSQQTTHRIAGEAMPNGDV
ncbi:hypothetical protein P5706_20610 [Pseudomonas sp. ChxA]|nr:hypothetical protein [Pseudomonas sp. ChxA]MDL2186595.1 hypothetical protein [Pseudomonas sp. ChxA]